MVAILGKVLWDVNFSTNLVTRELALSARVVDRLETAMWKRSACMLGLVEIILHSVSGASHECFGQDMRLNCSAA